MRKTASEARNIWFSSLCSKYDFSHAKNLKWKSYRKSEHDLPERKIMGRSGYENRGMSMRYVNTVKSVETKHRNDQQPTHKLANVLLSLNS